MPLVTEATTHPQLLPDRLIDRWLLAHSARHPAEEGRAWPTQMKRITDHDNSPQLIVSLALCVQLPALRRAGFLLVTVGLTALVHDIKGLLVWVDW
jgi:hypothetical protein